MIESEAGSYSAEVTAAGDVRGSVTLPSGKMPIIALARSQGSSEIAERERTIARGAITVRQRTRGGAPPEELEFRRNGKTFSLVAKEWERKGEVWLLRSWTQTLHGADGKPAISITVSLTPDAAPAVLRSPGPSGSGVRLAPSDQASVATDEGEPCEKEKIANDDAFARYEIACWGMLACLSGPWGCIGAYLAVCAAASSYDAAAAAYLLCLKKAGGEEL
jgi:hypothetical protein